MADISIKKLNHSALKIMSSMDIALELSSALSFQVPGYKFSPLYKMGKWDGFIRLFNVGSRTISSGLYHRIIEFCVERGYDYEDIVSDYDSPSKKTDGITRDSVAQYMEGLNLHTNGFKLDIREYQVEAVRIALLNRQAILLSSVGSGKSAMIYSTCRYITEELGLRVLIIVPTIGLTTQMESDFKDYSSETDWKVSDNVHLISGGISHTTNKPIVISTYQSLAKTDSEWFNSFGCIMSDEGHSITAKSFQDIYGKATEVPFRLAYTGTLHDLKCNIMQMEGLTGPVYTIATTKDLIDVGQLVPMKIKCISLDYPMETAKLFKKVTYEEEIKWLITNPKRNAFITKLAVATKGTTLVFFRYIEHGKLLFDMIKGVVGSTRPIYIIDGGVSKEDRESIRLMANNEDSIVLATFGTMKQGVNLPAIENIIVGNPVKGSITYLQSLGRGLRLKAGKSHCKLLDIGDNLSHRSKVNFAHQHFGERLKILTREGYDFSIVNVPF